MELKFEVNNQELVLITDTSKIANKSNNYLQLFFDFLTDDWLDKTKYCILKSSDQENFLFNVYDDVPVKVPSQVLIGRFFYITLYGVGNDDERITTNVLKVRILESDFSLKFSSVQGDYDAFNDLRNQIRLLDESISLVGKTGEYSDLLNIPSNFKCLFKHSAPNINTAWLEIGSDSNNCILFGRTGMDYQLGVYTKVNNSYVASQSQNNVYSSNTPIETEYTYIDGVQTVKANGTTLSITNSSITSRQYSKITMNGTSDISDLTILPL